MGVTIFVNSPADTANQTNNTNRLYPFDFTNQARKFKTFNLIARVRDIMNAIQGPKIIDINELQANDVNLISTRSTTATPWLSTLLSATNPFTYYGINPSTTTILTQPFLKVRRDGENANAYSAYTYDVSNYDEQASRVTSNAPSSSLYSYPFIFSNYTLDPNLRPLCVDPIIKHFWTTYTAPSSNPPQVSILKISDLNSNIKTKTLFPGALTFFPHNAVAIDCSTLSNSSYGKLYKISPYIIDLSDTVTGLYNAVTSTYNDSDIALALDNSMISQDIEFALFLGNTHVMNRGDPSGNTAFVLDSYKYDPVEAIYSYFSTKKYENNGNTLYKIATMNNFKNNIIVSNRLALTYLIQQAAKQMKIWLSPAQVVANRTYDANAINRSLTFNTNVDLTYVNSSIYWYWPYWVPYEYVKSSNDNMTLDNTQWVSGKGNRKVAKNAVHPRSFMDQSSYTRTYYNKYGQSLTFQNNWNNQAWPISIFNETIRGGSIYTTQDWNDDNILEDFYLEQSDYFPAPDLEFDI